MTGLDSFKWRMASPRDLIQAPASSNSLTITCPWPPYLSATESQAWITGGRRANSHVPLEVITAARPRSARWYLKSIANHLSPFHISVVLRFGIFKAAAAAARSMSSNSIGLSCGMSSREVSASQVKLGHFQESSRASKKRLASTINDAERCSSVRLALATARLTQEEGIRVGSQPIFQ